MKKVFLSLATLILTILMFTFPVSAAGNGTLSLSGTEGKQGDTITVPVNLNTNPGLITMKVAVSWGEGLELTGVSDTGLLDGYTTPAPTISSPYTLRWADSLATSNNTSTGKIATLTFKIKDGATVGNHNVTLTFSESRDASGGKNTFGNATATIKVTCKTHDWGDWQVTKKENCTAKGSEKRVCAICKESASQERNALGHSMGSWSQSKASTCESKGEQKRTCTRTGCTHYETKAIDALGHAFSKAVVTKKPTCTETGIESGTCTRCSKKTTNTLKAKGHTMGKYAVTLEATCVAEGKEEASCTVCGTKSEKTIAVVDHKYGEAVVTKQATETETGISTKTCTVCGNVVEEEIPMISDATDENIADEKDDIDVNSDANEDVVDEEGFDIGGLIWIIIALVLIALIAYLWFKKKK